MVFCLPCLRTEALPVEAVAVLGGDSVCWWHLHSDPDQTEAERASTVAASRRTSHDRTYYPSKVIT